MRKMRQFYEEWKSIAICSPLASKILEERIDAETLLSIQSDLYFFYFYTDNAEFFLGIGRVKIF